MEHIALANWFNTEVRSNPAAILNALSAARHLTENHEVMVRANNLALDSDEILEDDFHYYDEESIAFCGTQDFIHFLEAYVDFIA